MASKDNQIHIKNSSAQTIHVLVISHPSYAIADAVVGTAVDSLVSLSGGVDAASVAEVLVGLIKMSLELVSITGAAPLKDAQTKLETFKKTAGVQKLAKGSTVQVFKLDLLSEDKCAPSFWAAITSGEDCMIILVTDDGKKAIAFPTNSDHSWIVESNRIVRAKYGTTSTPDPDAGNFPFASTAGCIVYEHSSYKGKFMMLPEGSWTKKQIWNLDNDSITSIKIMAGYKVELFEDDNCQKLLCTFDNLKGTTTMSDHVLKKENNDKTDSIRVTRKK